MSDIKTVKGVIEKVDKSTFERDGVTKHRWVLLIEGLRISGFDEVPGPVAKAFEVGEEVNISYKTAGKYMNYLNMSGTGMLKTKPKVDSGFRPGGEVGTLSIRNLVEGNAGVMRMCIDASITLWRETQELDAAPPIEDVRTTATALFIEVNRDLSSMSASKRLELKGVR